MAPGRGNPAQYHRIIAALRRCRTWNYPPALASGKFTVNGRTVEQYFPNHAWKHDATEPLKFTSLTEQVDVVVTAHGGGTGGQAGAVRMGLSRSISRFYPELLP